MLVAAAFMRWTHYRYAIRIAISKPALFGFSLLSKY
jgi:hypothetical protein